MKRHALGPTFKALGISIGVSGNRYASYYYTINEDFDPNYVGGYFEP